MTYVSEFKYDIFISYALVDDGLLVGVDSGWVSTLVKTLESRLSAAIGRLGRLEPWWDRSQLHENQPLDQQIQQALEQTACLVVVLSPGFLESPWCPKELDAFRAAIEKQGRADSRIFVIDLGKVTDQQRMKVFSNYRPFDFWKLDDRKRRRILGFPAPHAQKDQDYYNAVEDLADRIKEEFDRMKSDGIAAIKLGGTEVEVPIIEAPQYGEDDFVLQIGERKNFDSLFPVELIHSSVGRAKNEMPLPFAAMELDVQLQNLKIAQLSARGTSRLINPKETERVRQFGAQMFERLIAGEIKDRYEQARSLAQRDRRPLPIKLCILASELASLPWEFLYDSVRNDFLTLSNLTPLVRFIMIADPPVALPVEGPLRILGVLSSPRDANLAPLDVRRERERIDMAVELLRKRREIDLQWLSFNTVDELQRALNDGPWHIFHFVGHGGFDDRNHEGVISMENGRGESLLLSASKLCKLLRDQISLRLVVLNACDTASVDESNMFSSMAGELVRQGIPAVLAMQFPISDEAAAHFAAHFYESLAKGQPVTQAVTEGRKAMHLDRDWTVEWGTPVLMTSSLDGKLFQMSQMNTEVGQEQEETLRIEEEEETQRKKQKEMQRQELEEAKRKELERKLKKEKDPLASPLWRDVRYWRRTELPVRLLVACNNSQLQRRLKSMSNYFDRSKPVFQELIDHEHFKTNQSFEFEWRDTSPSQLLAEAEAILQQDQIRLVVIVSDSLCDAACSGSNQPSDLVEQLRSKFFSRPHPCGLLALVPDDAHRVVDVDQTLSIRSLNRSELVSKITKIADGLRLKTPPGQPQILAADEAITVRLAQSASEIEDCLELRFQVYDRMGYLEEQLENAGYELDCYDTNSLHFAACSRAGDIVGTVRLILSRRLAPNEITGSVVGLVASETVRQQSEWVRQVANLRGDVLINKLTRPPYFASLPILQSTEFLGNVDNFGVIMRDVEKTMELSRLVVAPRFRGAGLSKLLVRTVIATATSLKAKQLLLECVPAHVGMYTGLGFERIPGTHGRAQELDQEAVGMRLELDVPMSRSQGLANNDLNLITTGFGRYDPKMLFGSKHLCMCANKECGMEGHFNLVSTTKCPLHTATPRVS